jgi:hypothetical protein
MMLLPRRRRAARGVASPAKDQDMDTAPNTIRVIVFKDGDLWVAQCLEYDIGAQAPDIDTLNTRLQVVLNAELKESLERHKTPFAGIPEAPKRFHVMWEHRARSVEVSPDLIGNRDKPVNLELGLVA